MGGDRNTEKKRPAIHKNIWLTEPFGSAEFYARLKRFYDKLEALRSKKIISSSPLKAMSVVDVFKEPQPLPANVYRNCFLVLPEDDRSIVDRLLRQEGIVEATVVFDDNRFADAGIETGVDYTNGDLIEKIFEPRSPCSFDLIDPAVYTRLVPGEVLSDLFEVPSSIKTALAGTLKAQIEKMNQERTVEDNTLILTRYGKRDLDARKRDVKTLASLITRYASHKDRDVNALASELTEGYGALFNEKRDIWALVFLKKQLEDATIKSGSFSEIRRLVAKLNEKISLKQKGLLEPRHKKKDSASEQFRILGYQGWKLHQK
jgi:hypothetical protein